MLYIKAYLIQIKHRGLLVFKNVTDGPSTQVLEIKMVFLGIGSSIPHRLEVGDALAAACVDSGPALALPPCSQV